MVNLKYNSHFQIMRDSWKPSLHEIREIDLVSYIKLQNMKFSPHFHINAEPWSGSTFSISKMTLSRATGSEISFEDILLWFSGQWLRIATIESLLCVKQRS